MNIHYNKSVQNWTLQSYTKPKNDRDSELDTKLRNAAAQPNLLKAHYIEKLLD